MKKSKEFEHNPTLEEFFELNLDLLCIADTEGNFIKVNKEWEYLLGYPVKKLLKRKFLDFIHPDDIEDTFKAIAKLQKQKKVINFTNRFVAKSGAIHTIEWRSFPKGKLIYAAARDITQKLEAEKQLRESEEKYRLFFEYSPLGVFQYDKKGVITDCNEYFVKIIGSSRKALIGLNTLDLPNQGIVKAIKGSLQGNITSWEGNYSSVTANKTTPVKVFFAPMLVDNKVIGGAGIVEDTTRQTRAIEELQETNAHLRAIYNSTPDLIFVFNEKTEIIDYKSEHRDYLFVPPQEFLHKPISSVLPPNIAKLTEEKLTLVFATGKTQVYEYRLDLAGKPHFFESRIVKCGQDQALAFVRDISERKEQEIKQQVLYRIANATMLTNDLEDLIGTIREHLTQLIDANNFYIALYDEKSDMLSIPYESDEKDNIETWPAAKSVTGLIVRKKQSLLLKKPDIQKLIETGQIDQIGYMCEVWLGVPLFSGSKVIGAIVVQDYDDPQAYDEDSKDILEFVSNHISLAVHRQKSIHDLVLAKDKAEESDRLKTSFLNNLSHEIRTPLNAIMGFSDILVQSKPDEPKRKHISEIIIKSGNQLLSIIDDIINISTLEAGLAEVTNKPADINEILDTAYHQVKSEADKKQLDLRLKSSLSNRQARVVTDATKLSQIIINLLQNALKFTSKGRIEMGCKRSGNDLRFYVSDTGKGMTEDDQKVVFDRFRQAGDEPSGEKSGMGLGLSISRSFAELLGGKMWVDSTIGKGSTFFFSIPYEPANPVAEKKEKNEGLRLSKKVEVLVAEDEQSSFDLINTILSMNKVKVYHAKNGQEAVDLCRNHPGISLVLMDIKMPVMGGLEATKLIKAMRPELSVVALTAYALPGDREKILAAGCDDYLSKPVSVNFLIERLKKYI